MFTRASKFLLSSSTVIKIYFDECFSSSLKLIKWVRASISKERFNLNIKINRKLKVQESTRAIYNQVFINLLGLILQQTPDSSERRASILLWKSSEKTRVCQLSIVKWKQQRSRQPFGCYSKCTTCEQPNLLKHWEKVFEAAAKAVELAKDVPGRISSFSSY